MKFSQVQMNTNKIYYLEKSHQSQLIYPTNERIIWI